MWTHWKRLWCWEGLGARGEGDDRGWDGCMASLTRWTWTPGVGDGQGGLARCDSWGRKESDRTERLISSDLIWFFSHCCIIFHFVSKKVKTTVKVLFVQLCLSLCDPMDFSLPGSYIHGISQGRSLEWVTIPFARGSSWPRDRIWVACLADTFFTDWATREAPTILYLFSYWKVSKSVNSLLLWTNIAVFTHSCVFL